MYCISNFLSLLVVILQKHNFFYLKDYACRFAAAHELQSSALDPDYGLFIGYQKPADKHKGLNTCLCLLRKNLKNLAKDILSAQYMNHRLNTEYCEGTSQPRPPN